MSRILLAALALVTVGIVAAGAATASGEATPQTLTYLATENPKREATSTAVRPRYVIRLVG